eukprot:TRINITY_DN11369_c0_g1_i3.p1 TRINITY_DN11369_c0_g1~~TRINITY_DN11369_c0_g1_i3.p1  ORF type:complete len:209 (-),score=38.27 TRINITY_DN11369_c0_g1_i3:135-761(-)
MTTVVGLPFSTFTRTICMGLIEKGVEFAQVEAAPHSDAANQHHPMGRIPSFGHQGFWLFESQAIARFIDTTFTTDVQLRPTSAPDCHVCDQWVSFIADYVFNCLEHKLIKPRLASDDSKSPVDLSDATQQTRKLLQILNDNMVGPYFLGESLSWADLFLLPILDDLSALPQDGALIEEQSKVKTWLETMRLRDSYQETLQGTLKAMRS